MQIKEYRIGVELLDEETRKPLEHLECEVEKNINDALDIYNNFITNKYSAKYLFVVLSNGEEIEILSCGY